MKPTTTAAECIADEGCFELLPDETYTTPMYQRGFSLKDKGNCTSEYNPNPGTEWTTLFEWEAGRWILPSYR
jgi:hypothetical protein